MKKMNRKETNRFMHGWMAAFATFLLLVGAWLVWITFAEAPELTPAIWTRPVITLIGAFFSAGMLLVAVEEQHLIIPAIFLVLGGSTAFAGFGMSQPLMAPGCVALWLGVVMMCCVPGKIHQDRVRTRQIKAYIRAHLHRDRTKRNAGTSHWFCVDARECRDIRGNIQDTRFRAVRMQPAARKIGCCCRPK